MKPNSLARILLVLFLAASIAVNICNSTHSESQESQVSSAGTLLDVFRVPAVDKEPRHCNSNICKTRDDCYSTNKPDYIRCDCHDGNCTPVDPPKVEVD